MRVPARGLVRTVLRPVALAPVLVGPVLLVGLSGCGTMT
ncbi:MAG: hypothetical protein JWP61_2806, partial [Friedmanniella sp.]|nr:hypothetical protein [Friedmanniella sp.]